MNGKENKSLGVKGAVRLEGVGRELRLFFIISIRLCIRTGRTEPQERGRNCGGCTSQDGERGDGGWRRGLETGILNSITTLAAKLKLYSVKQNAVAPPAPSNPS